MEIKNFTVESDYDKLMLHGTVYEPNGEKKGIVHILHGMSEYKERYLDFMQFLCENGYVAVCHDHRGHGDSVEKEADLGWFRDFHGKAIVDDAVKVTKYIQSQYPNLPVTLFGHSMGSMVVRCYVREHDDLIDKLIVCGTPVNNPLAGTAIFVEKCIRLFKGERHRSKMLAYLSTGKGNNNFPGEGKGAWLSQNRASIDAFYQNPKGRYGFTCNGFENLFNLMKRTYRKKGYLVKNKSLPVHFVSGSEDAVLGGEKNFNKCVEFFKQLGYTNVTSKLYAGLRHEILNEFGRETVFRDILSFLKS